MGNVFGFLCYARGPFLQGHNTEAECVWVSRSKALSNSGFTRVPRANYLRTLFSLCAGNLSFVKLAKLDQLDTSGRPRAVHLLFVCSSS